MAGTRMHMKGSSNARTAMKAAGLRLTLVLNASPAELERNLEQYLAEVARYRELVEAALPGPMERPRRAGEAPSGPACYAGFHTRGQ